MKRSVKFDLSWRAWSLIVGFFILIGFVGLSIAYNANGVGGNPAIMGHSAEEISGLPNFTSMDYVVDSWRASDGSSWYRKYKSGWIEQGGYIPGIPEPPYILNFPINFTDSQYVITGSTYSASHPVGFSSKNINNVQVTNGIVNVNYNEGSDLNWEAKGYYE